MRRAARVDGNQAAIVAAFRERGATVRPTHTVGKGFPDLAVGYCGWTVLVEVKDPAQDRCKRKLTPDEQAFHDEWQGAAEVVETEDDVARLLMRLRSAANLLERARDMGRWVMTEGEVSA